MSTLYFNSCCMSSRCGTLSVPQKCKLWIEIVCLKMFEYLKNLPSWSIITNKNVSEKERIALNIFALWVSYLLYYISHGVVLSKFGDSRDIIWNAKLFFLKSIISIFPPHFWAWQMVPFSGQSTSFKKKASNNFVYLSL